ncbi:hypothetical protein [Chitinivorax sp. B]|uniref:hypothetical protein n=1 Tax=Chitinivorax sp. B TaxID=2502235 RepID=UPI0010FA40DA|nr:hypothetical protein [Chitinivorax sp. B]
MYDLDNPAAPASTTQVHITGTLFKRWMKSCKSPRIDEGNAYQIVAMLLEGKKETLGTAEITPNWHLTMMGNRDSTVSTNFHFKIEIGKPYSHYWHYVLHRNATTQTWYWVGHPNPNCTATNQGGGGGGSDIQLIRSNLTLVQLEARQRPAMEKGMNKSIRDKLVAKLTQWDQAGIIQANTSGVFDGGTTV